MLETARSPGYKFMVEEWTRLRAQTLNAAPYTCPDGDSWQRARGELATWDHVLSTETQIDQALTDLLTDPDEDGPTNSLED